MFFLDLFVFLVWFSDLEGAGAAAAAIQALALSSSSADSDYLSDGPMRSPNSSSMSGSSFIYSLLFLGFCKFSLVFRCFWSRDTVCRN